MTSEVRFLVVVTDRGVRKRLVDLLGRYGTVLTRRTLTGMRRVLVRKSAIQVLITSLTLPDGDPLPVVRRFTKAKVGIDVPAAVIVPEISECEATLIGAIERADAYVLDPTLTNERLLPILAERWRRDCRDPLRERRPSTDGGVAARVAAWRSRFGLTDFQCALLHAAAGGSPVTARQPAEAVSDLLLKTGAVSYVALVEQLVREVIGAPVSTPRAGRLARGAARARMASGGGTRS